MESYKCCTEVSRAQVVFVVGKTIGLASAVLPLQVVVVVAGVRDW